MSRFFPILSSQQTKRCWMSNSSEGSLVLTGHFGCPFSIVGSYVARRGGAYRWKIKCNFPRFLLSPLLFSPYFSRYVSVGPVLKALFKLSLRSPSKLSLRSLQDLFKVLNGLFRLSLGSLIRTILHEPYSLRTSCSSARPTLLDFRRLSFS